MTEETKLKILELLSKGGIRANQLIIENSGSITYNDNGNMSRQHHQAELSELQAGVDQVRRFFWSDSAMAVIFCVCRDCYDYVDNMSQFERDFNCREGLVSNTFKNNPYMRLHIDNWAQNGAKQRVLQLVDEYQKAVDELIQF